MSAARFTKHGGNRLVLVRGGLDPQTLGNDSDWEAFSRCIGWQAGVADPPDGLEDRLVARLGLTAPPDVRLAADRAQAAGTASASEIVAGRFEGAGAADELELRRPLVGLRYVPVVAAMLAVAAAAILFFAAVISARSRPPSAFLTEPAREDVAHATAPSADSASPLDVPPDDRSCREPVQRDVPPPTKRAPLEKREAPKPPPPGAMVAARDESPVSVAAYHPTTFTLPREPGFNGGAVLASDMPARTSIGSATFVRTAAAIGPSAPVRVEAFERGLSAPAAAHIDAEPASAAWALSPENPRWVGATLAPPGGTGMPGVGVVAQIDLGKAFKL